MATEKCINQKATAAAMGSPPYPTSAQLSALHEASVMPSTTLTLHHLPVKGEQAACEVTLGPLTLPAYGVAHVGSFE